MLVGIFNETTPSLERLSKYFTSERIVLPCDEMITLLPFLISAQFLNANKQVLFSPYPLNILSMETHLFQCFISWIIHFIPGIILSKSRWSYINTSSPNMNLLLTIFLRGFIFIQPLQCTIMSFI